MKHFIKFFLVTLIIFTVIFTPAFAVFDKVGDIRIFESDTILAEDLPTLVDPNSPFFDAFTNSERVNVLLMGINTNLTDTILLASYDMNLQHVDLISVPRDTYYERESGGGGADRKINAAYHDGGAIGTATAVSDLLMGIPINFYMEIDYEGVGNIVEALGGVPMNIPFHMYYTDPYDDPPLKIDIPEGYQVLDKDTAIQFLRFRKGNSGYEGYREGDIGRIQAQQEFMISAFKQAIGLNLPSVIRSVLENVQSDMTLDTAIKIATNATKLNTDSIATYTVPGEARYQDNLSYYFADEEGIEEMLTQIYSLQPQTSSGSAIDSEGDSQSEPS